VNETEMGDRVDELLRRPRESDHSVAKLSYGAGRGGLIVDHAYWIKDGLARDSNLGCWSARRSTQRSVAQWSAEPGAEAAQIRRAGGWGAFGGSCGFRGCG
jgi:hypothetical protein